MGGGVGFTKTDTSYKTIADNGVERRFENTKERSRHNAPIGVKRKKDSPTNLLVITLERIVRFFTSLNLSPWNNFIFGTNVWMKQIAPIIRTGLIS